MKVICIAYMILIMWITCVSGLNNDTAFLCGNASRESTYDLWLKNMPIGFDFEEYILFKRYEPQAILGVEAFPDNDSEILLLQGITFEDMAMFDEALDYFDRSTQIDPQNADAWYHKGVAYFMVQKYEEALDCFENTTKLEPLTSCFWHNKGVSLQKLHRETDSETAFKRAKEFDLDGQYTRNYENCEYCIGWIYSVTN